MKNKHHVIDLRDKIVAETPFYIVIDHTNRNIKERSKAQGQVKLCLGAQK